MVRDIWPQQVIEKDMGAPAGNVLSVEEQIVITCQAHGIEPEIPLAIARLETGHFTSDAYRRGNNVGGMSVNEMPYTYKNLEKGVEAFVSNLADNYFAQGLTTPEAISKKYCPVNAEGWARAVKEIMEENTYDKL